MEKEELVGLIELAQRLAIDPTKADQIAFSGQSMSNILAQMKIEANTFKGSTDELVAVWTESVETFRDELVSSASERTMAPSDYIGTVLIQEGDARNAAERCEARKGPRFHRPGRPVRS